MQINKKKAKKKRRKIGKGYEQAFQKTKNTNGQ